ncbi:hypothetical protein BGX31_006064 [Mortierella sp. GBA43]|nr:hypothetical protein BGX31_006064 [Mortierella sp. GBA43]
MSSLDSISSDLLKDSSLSDPTHSYIAHRHYERRDIQDMSLLPLTPDNNQTAKSHVQKAAVSKPRPTFTRVARLSSPTVGIDTSSRDTPSSKTSQLDDTGMHSNQRHFGSSSLLRQDRMSSPAVKDSRISLTFPLSLSPPSAVPSLTSASTCCSSSSPLSPSQTSCFVFPTTERKDWLPCLDHTETLSPQDGKQVAPKSRSSTESDSEDEDEKAEQPMKLDAKDCIEKLDAQDNTLPLQHGFQRINPKTYFQARTRFSALPQLHTGFCSISQTPIKSSGEPSPQDFLGEADVPYPSPATLQERQARQQKRTEQLERLRIHEEREDRENLRRARQRRASFSAGMDSGLATPHSPASRSSSAPALLSRPPPASQQEQLPSPTSQLRRSPSSPVNPSSSRGRLGRSVRFDLRKTRIFEFQVVEEFKSYSRASSPT